MKTRVKLMLFLALMLIVTLSSRGTIEAVVVDGHNIAASVSGTPLKEVYQDYFKIGVGLNGSSIATDTINSNAMSEIIKYHFNSVTYSNLMKPDYLLDQTASIKNHEADNPEPAVKFDTIIKGMEFCQATGIKMRGHVLVWHTQTPDWFFREGYKGGAAYVDRQTMLLRLESYIRQVLEFVQSEYPGVIYAWDVVNEAVENGSGRYELESGFKIRTKHGEGNLVRDNPWYTVIGVDYVERSFEYARKYADPSVKLFYNDYNTFQPDKTQAIYNLAAHLKGKGLIDGIGMQGYMSLTYPGLDSGGNNFKAALTKFGELGLEIHLTELSINPEGSSPELFEKQAERYQALFRILTEVKNSNTHPVNITNVTVFGVMDDYLFYPTDTTTTRLFDGRLQPKPAFYAIAQLDRPWYLTKTLYGGPLQLLDGEGVVVANVFPGQYETAAAFGADLDLVKSFKVGRGYLLEVFEQEGEAGRGQIFMGDIEWEFTPDLFANAELIVLEEDDSQNLVLNGLVEASHLGDRAERAVDGQLMSSWSPNEEAPYWISADLGELCLINRWVVYHRGGGGFAPGAAEDPLNTADFKLQISHDQKTWQDVDVVNDNLSSITDRTIAPVEARYVRLLIERPTSLEFNQNAVIYEWEVYGLKGNR